MQMQMSTLLNASLRSVLHVILPLIMENKQKHGREAKLRLAHALGLCCARLVM